MKKQSGVLIVFGVLAGMVFATSQKTFAASPSDGCALLTPAQVEKVVGQPFEAPKKLPLLPPFGEKWGSHCIYRSQNDRNVVVDFFVYVTASPAQAKQWFDMGQPRVRRNPSLLSETPPTLTPTERFMC